MRLIWYVVVCTMNSKLMVFSLGAPPVCDVNNVAFQLEKHKFPAGKWKQLANALKLAGAVPNIEANGGSAQAMLQALIIHWTSNDPAASWQKLVDAVVMCEEKVIATKLDKEVRVPRSGVAQHCCADLFLDDR